jgi:outer membrane immunogenic protein
MGGVAMKWLLLGTALALSLIAPLPALSADLGPIAPAYPSAPPPLIWTGCYIGANIGGGWARRTFTNTTKLGEVTLNTSGILGGGQFGCNYQFSQNFVVGFEGGASGADVSGSTTLFTTNQGDVKFDAKANWLASATARFGYAAGPWLFYVKGGGAWTHESYDVTANIQNNANLTVTSASDTPLGWTFGGGIEYAFLTNWSARLEYDFYDFGSHNLTFSGLVSPTFDVKHTIQALTLGVNYRFW